MKKKLLLSLTILVGVLSLSASEHLNRKSKDANVVGHIVDKTTKEHLIGISVFIKGTTIGTSSDASGHFYLKNVPSGKHSIIMRAVGFKTIEKTVNVKKSEVLELTFEAEEDAIALEQVVVSSNRNETSRKLAPNLVTVLDTKTFERANASSLAQGLVFQPGLRVENNCQNCGFNQVRINGLDGKYSQILIDSKPIFSALSGVYGLEQIPPTMIERVEIVRGGGSALYGSSAVAGVVNIITKEPVKNSAHFSNSLTLIGGASPDNVTSFGASVLGKDNKSGIYVYGQNRERASWDYDNDGFSEIGIINGRNLGLRSFIKTSNYSKLSLEYHNIQEYRRGGDLLDKPPHEAYVCESTTHYINGGEIKFEGFSPDTKHHYTIYTSLQDVKRDSYYGGEQSIENYGKTKGFTIATGGQYSYDFDNFLFMPSQLMTGVEYIYDKLHDEMPRREFSMKQSIHNPSFFVQNEWKNNDISILLGARLDKHSLISTPILSPRATLRYNPNEHINLRFSYSEGFRAPQIFDEELHVGVVNGETARITNDEELKEERSKSISVSSDLYHKIGDIQFNLLVEGFYSHLDDAFSTSPDPSKESSNDGVKHLLRQNSTGANVFGTNLEARILFGRIFNIQTGITIQKAEYKDPQVWGEHTLKDDKGAFSKDEDGNYNTVENEDEATRNMLRTPNLYGYFTASFNPTKKLTIALTGTYTGSMSVAHVIEVGKTGLKEADSSLEDAEGNHPQMDKLIKTKSFFDLGSKISYDFNLFGAANTQVYAGINNIFNSFQNDFDKYMYRDSGFIYGPTLPRSYYFGIKFDF